MASLRFSPFFLCHSFLSIVSYLSEKETIPNNFPNQKSHILIRNTQYILISQSKIRIFNPILFISYHPLNEQKRIPKPSLVQRRDALRKFLFPLVKLSKRGYIYLIVLKRSKRFNKGGNSL